MITKIRTTLSDNVTLIAASKTRTMAEIQSAKQVGIQHFGENYVQEAENKQEAFKGVTLHLIGKLQTNKAKQAATLFDVIHTIASEKLADKLESACEGLGKTMDIFIQVNIGDEPQKNGVPLAELDSLVEKVQSCEHLHLLGLMVIPPANVPPTPYFAKAQALTEEYGFSCLSMGMSGDYQEAIQYGATHVRIGTALFGVRK